jgi:uncharacterized protein DUF3551
MKPSLFFLGLGAAVLALAAPAFAQNYPWCSNFHDGGGTNCGFSTYEQCMATAQGSGGNCTKNNIYAPSAGPSPARHAARKHRPGR